MARAGARRSRPSVLPVPRPAGATAPERVGARLAPSPAVGAPDGAARGPNPSRPGARSRGPKTQGARRARRAGPLPWRSTEKKTNEPNHIQEKQAFRDLGEVRA
jgi:hypothetical protein